MKRKKTIYLAFAIILWLVVVYRCGKQNTDGRTTASKEVYALCSNR